jgi:cation diffusion facilitator family transporter
MRGALTFEAVDRSAGPPVVLVALALTCLLGAAKIAVGVATSSLAVLSQALDSVLDIVALLFLYFAVRIAAKPADAEHHYGHAKAENLAAFTQTLILGAVVGVVAVEAVARLGGPAEAVGTPWYAFALLTTSIGVDAARVRLLAGTARRENSDALRAGALNFVTDIGTALVALGSLAAVRAGLPRADAIGSLIVATAVAVAAYKLGRRSVDVLLDRAPAARTEEISRAAARAPGVAETRRVRVRGSDKGVFADVTVTAQRTASLERAHDIAEEVEQEIARVAPDADVVVHVEPSTDSERLVERVQAAASRTPGVHEVHNVLVHSVGEPGLGELRVTLHAKVEPHTSLQDAHELADRIEEAVGRELGSDVRVDAHIEPLEESSRARDVTSEMPDLVAGIKRVAVDEPDVLDCHEVLVTATGEELSIVAHVHGRGDLPLERIHASSQRIENAIHAMHPEIGPVLIHFEPL